MIQLNIMLDTLMKNLLYVVYLAILHKSQDCIGYQRFPSERRKGYGRAMQEYRLKRAQELGYHVAVLQASNEGYPLYRKLGYKEYGHFREYKKLK